MPLSGTFRQYSLPEVLRMIESGQRSGVLVVTDGTRQAAVYFDGGQWLLGDRIGSPLLLIHRLLRAGLIAEAQVEAVTGMPFAQAAQLSEVQLARALVQAGVLAHEQIRLFIQDDAVALLALLCGWTDGEFAFEEAVQVPRGRLAIPLPTGALVALALGGDRLSAPPSRLAPLHPGMTLAFVEPEAGAAGMVQVTREQWTLLSHVDGHTPLWAIAEKLQQPEQAVLRVASELVAAGMLQPAPQFAPAAS
ncbi:MAG TPA: DUF4388 domain-containing protein [Ktedonobacterales bacterium]